MRPLFVVMALMACAGADSVSQTPNQLTAEERADGFVLLFNGRTLEGWRGFKGENALAGWGVIDGSLTRTGSGGDLLTTQQYDDFELRLEWKVGPRGNSGIMFRVTEDAERTYHTGPEMQVLDDAGHADGASRLTAAGSNYGLHPAPEGVVRPLGQWNEARLVVRGSHVEHWLNGHKVVEYELWTPEWEALVAASKFAQWPTYGRATRGHLVLQDHGDRIEFRSIRVKELR